jgi:low affinity Fe/Cu permease
MRRQSDRPKLDYEVRPKAKSNAFNEVFRKIAASAAAAVGSKWAFITAVLLIALWACSYPLFKTMKDGFNTWQLVINTLTTIITFLMVFLIQNTQNRDAKAIHLKLDELIRGVKGARTGLVNLQEFSDEELEELQKQFESLRTRAAERGERAQRKAEVAQEVAEHAHEAAHTAKEIAEDASEDAREAVKSGK